ncbi:MAG: NAD-binding protein [Thermodesulfovibrio sp.]|nr:NAD-binding protein [Thermodesulfovibrio sp.]MDW7972786.1 NAD-binding protein [Thermodesulfovibrio sp.]
MFLDIFYYTLKIFHSHPLPKEADTELIRIARAIVPLSFIIFSATAVFALLKDRIRLFLARFTLKEHCIIVGLSHMSLRLMDELIKRGERVVIINDNEESPFLATCKAKGILVLNEEPTNINSFVKSRFREAKRFYVFLDDDLKNIKIAKMLFEKLKQIKRDYHIHVHISDFWLKVLYDSEGVLHTQSNSDKANITIQAINFYDELARYLFLTMPIDNGVDKVFKPWIIIVGTGRVGQSLLYHTIKMKVYPEDRKLRITMIGPKANELGELFFSRFSKRILHCDNQQEELIFNDLILEFKRADYFKLSHPIDLGISMSNETPQAVFICAEDDIETKKLKGELDKFLKTNIVTTCTLYVSYYTEIEEKNSFNVFKLASKSLLEKDEIDKLARLIHTDFIIKDLRAMFNLEIENIDPTKVEEEIRIKYESKYRELIESRGESRKFWGELKEIYKNSNRNQADHIFEKLRIISPSKKL